MRQNASDNAAEWRLESRIASLPFLLAPEPDGRGRRLDWVRASRDIDMPLTKQVCRWPSREIIDCWTINHLVNPSQPPNCSIFHFENSTFLRFRAPGFARQAHMGWVSEWCASPTFVMPTPNSFGGSKTLSRVSRTRTEYSRLVVKDSLLLLRAIKCTSGAICRGEKKERKRRRSEEERTCPEMFVLGRPTAASGSTGNTGI